MTSPHRLPGSSHDFRGFRAPNARTPLRDGRNRPLTSLKNRPRLPSRHLPSGGYWIPLSGGGLSGRPGFWTPSMTRGSTDEQVHVAPTIPHVGRIRDGTRRRERLHLLLHRSQFRNVRRLGPEGQGSADARGPSQGRVAAGLGRAPPEEATGDPTARVGRGIRRHASHRRGQHRPILVVDDRGTRSPGDLGSRLVSAGAQRRRGLPDPARQQGLRVHSAGGDALERRQAVHIG